MINAAIVGLGWWGGNIASALHGSDRIRVVRGIDADSGTAQAFAADHDVPVSASFRDGLDDPEVQAMILATPHSLHEEQIVLAAGAGKHVFCEKPLSLTKSSAERAIAACDEAGVVLGVGHQRRFEPALVEIKRLVESGELGTIMHVEANYSHDKLAGVSPDSWRASPVDAPAAGMTGMGVHLTDAFINMLGSVDEVFGLSAKRVVASESGDVVSVLLGFASGVTGYLNAILATPVYLRFNVFGSLGCHLTLCRKGGSPETRAIDPIDTVRANFEAFAEAAEGGASYPITREQKLHNIAVLEAIVASVATGKAVTVS
jgi:predicted dehydrogenase